jgi:predicted RNase H-like HicB family nuclease
VVGSQSAGSVLAKGPAFNGWEVAMKFKVALYASEEGYSVSLPALVGCWSQGATAEEALTNVADAIREYLEAEVPPQDGAEVREVEVAV